MTLKFIVPFALVILVALSLVIWVYPSNRDFGPDNRSWNGIAEFCSDFDPVRMSSLSELPSPAKDTNFVLIPYEPFDDIELEQIAQYTASGGTLVLMDDYGHGNQILEYLKVTPRFTNEVLRDPLFCFRTSALPEVTWIEAGESVSEERTIVLNHATSLSDVPDGNIDVWSSRFSYLDVNDNSVWDSEDEPGGPFPIACSIGYKLGQLQLIADPSILIMMDKDDNHTYVSETIAGGEASPAIYLDESHLPPSSLETSQGVLERIQSTLSSSPGVVVLVLVALLVVIVPVWRRKTKSAFETLQDRERRI